ncbi:MAG: hypothetical protein HC927_06585 [Deltaproteobacteria bacterium]|nr:hypothetical protein [Deltaproteobacteria bacterium]
MSRRPSRWELWALPLGLAFVFLGLWLAPREARRIRAPFLERGETKPAFVERKHESTRAFEGQDRTYSYREYVIEVRIPDEADRRVEIGDLVLARDYRALEIGDEVSLTYIHGGPPPYYLLTSSVEASTWAFLPWAFNGRPASGLAIAAMIPGICIVLIAGAVLFDRRRRTP